MNRWCVQASAAGENKTGRRSPPVQGVVGSCRGKRARWECGGVAGSVYRGGRGENTAASRKMAGNGNAGVKVPPGSGGRRLQFVSWHAYVGVVWCGVALVGTSPNVNANNVQQHFHTPILRDHVRRRRASTSQYPSREGSARSAGEQTRVANRAMGVKVWHTVQHKVHPARCGVCARQQRVCV